MVESYIPITVERKPLKPKFSVGDWVRIRSGNLVTVGEVEIYNHWYGKYLIYLYPGHIYINESGMEHCEIAGLLYG